ncbi:MAG: amidohydrolase family protein [Chitinophagaceae bacterium]
MVYEKLRGDHLFDGKKLHGNDKVLIIGKAGISEVIDLNEAGDDVQYIPGLITPGFANSHCHLELSHMKGIIPVHTGLVPFLINVIQQRNISDTDIEHAIDQAIKEMQNDGIIAVGDICNTALTVPHKLQASIHWHNFIEVLSLNDANAEIRIKQNLELLQQFSRAGLKQTVLSPHAPYSISAETFRKINQSTAGKTITIHNQESSAENELYISGGGPFLQLYEHLGFSTVPILKTGKSSIQSFLPNFNLGQKIILVHNTYMTEADIQWANEYASSHEIELAFCFCINANLYIENTCPNIPLFIKNNCQIILGTDSYSSNWNLKISEEIKTIHQKFPQIPVEEILRWSTINGLNTLNAQSSWITGSKVLEKIGYSKNDFSDK